MSSIHSNRSSKIERWKEAKSKKKAQRLREQSDKDFIKATHSIIEAQKNLQELMQYPTPSLDRYDHQVDLCKKEILSDVEQFQNNLTEYDRKIRRLTNLEEIDISQEQSASKRWWETLLFYAFLMGILFVANGVLSESGGEGVPRNIMGYSPMTVLTKSMQSVYPKDSLIITKVTEPKDLQIGDDITYLKENNSTVTHRIVGITENYMGSGERGFETKGVENPYSDDEIVRGSNVVGKVIYSNELLGELLIFIREHLVLTAVIGALTIYLIDLLIKYYQINRKSKKFRYKKGGRR